MTDSIKNATSSAKSKLNILVIQNNNAVIYFIKTSSDPIPLINEYIRLSEPSFSAVLIEAENKIKDTFSCIVTSLKASQAFKGQDVEAAIYSIWGVLDLNWSLFVVSKNAHFSRAEQLYAAIGAQTKPGSGCTRAEIVEELKTITLKKAVALGTSLLKSFSETTNMDVLSFSTALQWIIDAALFKSSGYLFVST